MMIVMCVCVCVCFWGEKKMYFEIQIVIIFWVMISIQTQTDKHIELSSHIWWLSSNQIKSTPKKQLTRNFSWLFLIFAVCWCNNFWKKKQLNHLIMIQLEHCDFFPEKTWKLEKKGFEIRMRKNHYFFCFAYLFQHVFVCFRRNRES